MHHLYASTVGMVLPFLVNAVHTEVLNRQATMHESAIACLSLGWLSYLHIPSERLQVSLQGGESDQTL